MIPNETERNDIKMSNSDTRWMKSNRRYYSLLNDNNEKILTVNANLYFPDCFKWKKLYEKGWKVHVIGVNLPKERGSNGA